MDKQQIKKLYQLNVELEGLLRVLESRDSESARALLKTKFNEYSNELNALLEGRETTEKVVSDAVADTKQILERARQTEVKDQEAVESEMTPMIDVAADKIKKGEQIKVDEMLSRKESADLKKAFTLNDKFRFRRELFNGSEAEFDRTLDLLVAMGSYEEAKKYLVEDLLLDERQETVADFLAIIKRHFSA